MHLFNEVGHMVKAILHDDWFLYLNSFSFNFSLGPLQKSLLGSFVFRAVLKKYLEQICR